VAGKSTSNFDPVLPGVDLDVALSIMRGNRVRLFRLLRMFAAGHGKDLVQMRQALASNDTGSAERMAHSLKGAAGTLGVRRVYEQASELNTLLRSGAPTDVVENLLTLLEMEMADVCTGIELQLTI
jgi:two-component system, sensor histidine kinase and response regulator